MANFLRPKTWDDHYSQRRPTIYQAENDRLEYEPGDDSKALIDAFLFRRHGPNELEPPRSLTFVALNDFLGQGRLKRLPSGVIGNNSEDAILLDDRTHPSERASTLGLGKDEDHRGKIGHSKALSAQEYYDKTFAEQRHEASSNAEKRNIFIASPSPGTMLAIAATCARRTAHILRGFMQKYLLFQPSFEVVCTNASFALEFHLPYYALREEPTTKEKRTLHSEPLRRSTPLPLGRNKIAEQLRYHQAKISCLITGVDDFLWTSYCFADTSFGSEHMKSTYLKALDGKGLDAASGGSMNLNNPFWNPRDYFLTILSQRINQARLEWRNLLQAYDQRLEHYKVSCFDNAELDGTQDLRAAVDTIHEFKCGLGTFIMSWKTCKERYLHWFEVKEKPDLKNSFNRSLDEIDDSMVELLFWHDVMGNRYTQFSGMLSRVMGASGLRHNIIATQLAYYMKLVAGITLFFSSVNLITSLFSMTMVSPHMSSATPVLTILCTAFLAHRLARRPDILRKVFPMGDG